MHLQYLQENSELQMQQKLGKSLNNFFLNGMSFTYFAKFAQTRVKGLKNITFELISTENLPKAETQNFLKEPCLNFFSANIECKFLLIFK